MVTSGEEKTTLKVGEQALFSRFRRTEGPWVLGISYEGDVRWFKAGRTGALDFNFAEALQTYVDRGT